MQQRRFIVRKYVMAKSAAEALRLEKKAEATEVFLDEKWLEIEDGRLKKPIGFSSAP